MSEDRYSIPISIRFEITGIPEFKTGIENIKSILGELNSYIKGTYRDTGKILELASAYENLASKLTSTKSSYYAYSDAGIKAFKELESKGAGNLASFMDYLETIKNKVPEVYEAFKTQLLKSGPASGKVWQLITKEGKESLLELKKSGKATNEEIEDFKKYAKIGWVAVRDLGQAYKKEGKPLISYAEMWKDLSNKIGLSSDELKMLEGRLQGAGLSLEEFLNLKATKKSPFIGLESNLRILDQFKEKTGIAFDEIAKAFPDFKFMLTKRISPETLDKLMEAYTREFENLSESQQNIIRKYWSGRGINIDEVSQQFKLLGYSINTFAKSGNLFTSASQTISENFKLIDEFSKKTGISFDELASGIPNFSELMTRKLKPSDVESIITGLTKEYGTLSDASKEVVNKFYKTTRGIDVSGLAKDLASFGVPLEQAVGGFKDVDRGMRTLIRSMATVRGFAEQNMITMTDLSAIYPELGSSIMTAIKPEALLGGIIRKTADYMSLSMEEQRALAKFWESKGVDITEAFVGARGIVYGTKEASLALKQVQGELGSTGMAVMLLGRQMLWVGLGSMFLSMSMERVFKSNLKTKQSALTLLRTEIALTEQKKQLRDIISEYGAGSEEARKAITEYNLAQEQAKVQNESLIQSIRSENLAMAQMVLSGFGQIVAMGTMINQPIMMLNAGLGKVIVGAEQAMVKVQQMTAELMKMYGITDVGTAKLNMNSIAMAQNTEQLQTNILAKEGNALSTNTLSASTEISSMSKQIETNATAQNTRAELQDAVAKQANANSILFLIPRIAKLLGIKMAYNQVTATTLMLENLLWGAITIGGTMLATYAFTEWQTKMQSDALNESTKNLKKNIDKLRKGSGVVDLNASMEKYNNTLYESIKFSNTMSGSVKTLEMNVNRSIKATLPPEKIAIAEYKYPEIKTADTELVQKNTTSIGSIIINVNSSNGDPREIANEVNSRLIKRLTAVGVA